MPDSTYGVESLLSYDYEDRVSALASATVQLFMIGQTKKIKIATEAEANQNGAVSPKPLARTPPSSAPTDMPPSPSSR